MRIDSHHHLWNYDALQYPWISPEMAALRRDFQPADLDRVLGEANIDGAVTVQARQSLVETDWLLRLAQTHESILGVVGWIPLAENGIEGFVEEYSESEYLKGVRHVIQDEPDDAFILGEQFNAGVKSMLGSGWVYDILIYARHLKNSILFVDQHPEQQFVLDHIAKPTIQSAQFDKEWKLDILELAKRENVVCKFSGVATEVRDEEWTRELIQPYWDTALEAFGPQRLMFGSDWPVCLLKTEYSRWVQTVAELASVMSEQEQALFWGGTAKQIYGL